ncbi:MAG: GAK system CofD-like protein [Deltaproteobacteria bacterium]|nr:GAK system CofD-like protein [Deltaproteobacteria bacterium]
MTRRVTLCRSLELPDPLRLARYARAPELGPRLLFFSGGTALAGLSRRLTAYTHHSVHLITPFDSGGSSAVLRRAFNMLAVGDLRNRLMALADQSVQGNPEIVELFAFRFPKPQPPEALRRELDQMIRGRHHLVSRVPDPMRKIIRNHLGFFRRRMPPDFDLAGASVGNLVLTGGYLNNRRHIDPVVFMFSKLAEVRGLVRPVVTADLHLGAELADGRVVLGQHLLTGKVTAPLTSPLERLFLNHGLAERQEARARIRAKVRQIIGQAELIVFPMGSFYTSLLATLLPEGVGRAVAAAPCPKVFVPNVLGDPEMLGLNLTRAVTRLLAALQADAPRAPVGQLLNLVMVDSDQAAYPGGPPDLAEIRGLGVEVVDLPLVTPEAAPLLDPGRVADALLSLV